MATAQTAVAAPRCVADLSVLMREVHMEDSSDDVVGSGQPGTGRNRAADDDEACWQHAARLRREHPAWVVIWVASIHRYRAYRLSRSRRDSALTAETPDDLATQISRAEQARS
jgi:hypothetical protein